MQLPAECTVICQISEDPLLIHHLLLGHQNSFLSQNYSGTNEGTQCKYNQIPLARRGEIISAHDKTQWKWDCLWRCSMWYPEGIILLTIHHSHHFTLAMGIQTYFYTTRINAKSTRSVKAKHGCWSLWASQSSYQSHWFVMPKKNGKLCIVHDLQPFNKITIRDAGMFTNHRWLWLKDLLDTNATLYWSFLGLWCKKNTSPKQKSNCIHDSPRTSPDHLASNWIYQFTCRISKMHGYHTQRQIPIQPTFSLMISLSKDLLPQYLDQYGKPKVLPDNLGIWQFIWGHAQDVHWVMHQIQCAGATFSSKKSQICLSEALIVDQHCNAQGRETWYWQDQ